MDLTTINEALGLASSAVGLTSKAASTISVIKGLFEGEKTPGNSETSKLLSSLVNELTMANMTNVQLSQALKVLSQELLRQDEFEREKARYALFQTGQGDIVYTLKEDMADGQPMHFICPVCLNRDKLISFIRGEGDYKQCQSDKKHLYQFKNTPRKQRIARSSYWSS